MEAIIAELTKAIKAGYDDPNPEHGTLTDVFYRNQAVKMIEQQPEKVIPILQAYDVLVKGVNT
jgi:hypothetical protein